MCHTSKYSGKFHEGGTHLFIFSKDFMRSGLLEKTIPVSHANVIYTFGTVLLGII